MKKPQGRSKKPPITSIKAIAAVRHGHYDDGNSSVLSNKGREQSIKLAKKLREMIPFGTSSMKIFTSDIPRALQTAEIIAAEFYTAPQILPELKNPEFKNGRKIHSILLKKVTEAEGVIVITHSQAPSGVAHTFARIHCGKKVKKIECEMGNGFLVDLNKKRVVTNLFPE